VPKRSPFFAIYGRSPWTTLKFGFLPILGALYIYYGCRGLGIDFDKKTEWVYEKILVFWVGPLYGLFYGSGSAADGVAESRPSCR
jgi:hypothetical protein